MTCVSRVGIHGSLSPLGRELVARLLHLGCKVIVSNSAAEEINRLMPALLQHSTGGLIGGDPFNETGPLVVFSNSCGSVLAGKITDSISNRKMLIQPSHALVDDSADTEETCLIEIHDMIHPDADENWSSNPFKQWYDGTILPGTEVKDIGDEYHWVSWRDVIEAVAILTLGNETLPPWLSICGRRTISGGETKQQFQALLNRSLKVLRNDLEIDDLVKKMSFSESENKAPSGQRPDLSRLHDALKASGSEDGWRPVHGLEVTMMEWIANKLERNPGIIE